jgi:hypothetical protein
MAGNIGGAPGGGWSQGQTRPYWNTSGYTGYYSLPSRTIVRPGEERKSSKKVLYVLAVLLLVLGGFLIYTGVTAEPPKITSRLAGLGDAESAVVGVSCLPNLCGAAQEASLIVVVGKDNYKGTVRTKFGQEVMIARATGSQVLTLADKDWVVLVDRVE